MLKNVKLQEFMDRRGLTQQQLADKIGVTRGVIGKWNTQKSDVTRENCAKLLLAGMTLEEMFGEEVAQFVTKSILENADQVVAKPPEDCRGEPKFLSGVEKSLMEMKIRGFIKEELPKAIYDMKTKVLL